MGRRDRPSWLLRTFWWGLLWTIISTVLMIVGVGFLIYGVLAIWYIYRVVRGLINFSDRRDMPR